MRVQRAHWAAGVTAKDWRSIASQMHSARMGVFIE
jgi:hypothetical protein